MSGYKPKLFWVLKGYTKQQFTTDLLSGFIVAIIALPLSIAFALGCGVSPEKGVYSAIISSIIIAILGGSRVQINGPTGAFIVIIQSVIVGFGVQGLTIATIIAGIMLLIMGAFKLGKIVKYIPAPITIGFTAGIGVTIFTLEIKDLLGIALPQVMPTNFFGKWGVYVANMNTINMQALLLGLLCIVILVIWPRINKKIPGSLIAIVIGTSIAYFFKLDVNLLGTMPKIIQPTALSPMSLSALIDLIPSAFTIAILIALQALLSAAVTDGIIVSKTNTSVELIAQGVANIILGFLGCIPATGGVARSIANAKNGARTPIAAIVHGITLFLMMLFLMPLIKLVPLCVLAAILIVVSVNMLNIPVFLKYRNAPKSDSAVLLTAFILTFAFDLVFAILFGVILACCLFMKRMSDVTDIYPWKDPNDILELDDAELKSLHLKPIPKDTIVFEISGPLFFGAVEKFMMIRKQVTSFTKVVILRMSSVPSIDATALSSLQDLHTDLEKTGVSLVLSHVQEQPLKVLTNSGLYDSIGADHFHDNIDAALAYASKTTKKKKK